MSAVKFPDKVKAIFDTDYPVVTVLPPTVAEVAVVACAGSRSKVLPVEGAAPAEGAAAAAPAEGAAGKEGGDKDKAAKKPEAAEKKKIVFSMLARARRETIRDAREQYQM